MRELNIKIKQIETLNEIVLIYITLEINNHLLNMYY